MVWSFVYLALCRLVQLVVLLRRSERSKELEILILRHELAILADSRCERGSVRRSSDPRRARAGASAKRLDESVRAPGDAASLAPPVACDFFTVETAWLKRIYVLFFISLERRRAEFVACTPSRQAPGSPKQAPNLLMTLDDREQPLRLLMHTIDAKFSGGCDQVSKARESL